MGKASREAAIMAGEEIPDVRRPCGREGCPGTYTPYGSPHFDADGSAMISLTCDAGCGMQSVAYWSWEGDGHSDGDEDPEGEGRDVWAEVDADLRRRGSIW